MKICVLIPSYNEARTIGRIVKEIKDKSLDVIVIDDGSTDDTQKCAARSGATVIRHGKNLGKGASIKEGFNHVLRETDFDGVIVMDGDGQHNPSDIQKFISHASNYADDIIVGNRMEVIGNMPAVRFLTNKFMSNLLSLVCKQNIPDTQCGFRFVKRSVLENVKLQSNNYDLESEMLVKASRKGFKIASCPIETIYSGEVSRIDPIKDVARFVVLLVKSYFH